MFRISISEINKSSISATNGNVHYYVHAPSSCRHHTFETPFHCSLDFFHCSNVWSTIIVASFKPNLLNFNVVLVLR